MDKTNIPKLMSIGNIQETKPYDLINIDIDFGIITSFTRACVCRVLNEQQKFAHVDLH